jgi:hypothetical protein
MLSIAKKRNSNPDNWTEKLLTAKPFNPRKRLHCKKRLAIFLSPAGRSLTKPYLAGNNFIIPGQERLVSDHRLCKRFLQIRSQFYQDELALITVCSKFLRQGVNILDILKGG